jgi:P4 family phage/plasmid primase-like protien
VFRDPEVLDYVLTVFASFLHGSIRQERFHIWTGSGSNGKSCCVDLFEHAFGDYCCKFPVALLTQKRVASNAATSELARAKGRRFACLQEPGEDERLNIGFMKELTGGDKVFGRLIYKEPIEFKPQFKMILTCNHLPAVPSDDGGTWRRIRVVEFTSRFVENPNPNNASEFKLDTTLTSRFNDWRTHFMALLVHTYDTVVKTHGIVEPEPVMACTLQYQRENDRFSEFFDSHIVPREGSSIAMDTLYDEFKFYVRTANPNVKLASLRDLSAYLVKRLGLRHGSRTLRSLVGFAMRTNADDEAEADADQ